MERTKYLGLSKPSPNDFYSNRRNNENRDIIDGAIGDVEAVRDKFGVDNLAEAVNKLGDVSGNGNLPIDRELSETSQNAIANDVVTAKITEIENNVNGINDTVNGLNDDISNVNTALGGKVNDVSFNEETSELEIYKGGALDKSIPISSSSSGSDVSIVIDRELSATSQNAIANDIVTSKFEEVENSINGLSDVADELSTTVNGLSDTVGGLNDTVSGLSDTVGGLSDDISAVNTSLSNKVDDISLNEETSEIEIYKDGVKIKSITISGNGSVSITVDDTPTDGSSNPVSSGGVFTALSNKQDTLTFDTTPKAGSTNPITSGGVNTALAKKQNSLTFDSTPTEGSNNPVTSDGIFQAIANAGGSGGSSGGSDVVITPLTLNTGINATSYKLYACKIGAIVIIAGYISLMASYNNTDKTKSLFTVPYKEISDRWEAKRLRSSSSSCVDCFCGVKNKGFCILTDNGSIYGGEHVIFHAYLTNE